MFCIALLFIIFRFGIILKQSILRESTPTPARNAVKHSKEETR